MEKTSRPKTVLDLGTMARGQGRFQDTRRQKEGGGTQGYMLYSHTRRGKNRRRRRRLRVYVRTSAMGLASEEKRADNALIFRALILTGARNMPAAHRCILHFRSDHARPITLLVCRITKIKISSCNEFSAIIGHRSKFFRQ